MKKYRSRIPATAPSPRLPRSACPLASRQSDCSLATGGSSVQRGLAVAGALAVVRAPPSGSPGRNRTAGPGPQSSPAGGLHGRLAPGAGCVLAGASAPPARRGGRRDRPPGAARPPRIHPCTPGGRGGRAGADGTGRRPRAARAPRRGCAWHRPAGPAGPESPRPRPGPLAPGFHGRGCPHPRRRSGDRPGAPPRGPRVVRLAAGTNPGKRPGPRFLAAAGGAPRPGPRACDRPPGVR